VQSLAEDSERIILRRVAQEGASGCEVQALEAVLGDAMDDGEADIRYLDAPNQKLMQVARADVGRQLTQVGRPAHPVVGPAIIIGADAHDDAGKTLRLGKVGGKRFAKAFADTVEVDGPQRRSGSQLHIPRIAAHYPCAAGEDHAATPLV